MRLRAVCAPDALNRGDADARDLGFCRAEARNPRLHEALLPVPDAILAVPTPAAVNRMIRARQTCFCGLFRSATIASRRA